ncbi:nucleotidyltransferase domain-containing protein [Candidatus Woesearchaeota archaeon]|nr:nucleotidyltransferase domain-containing protein [Candidatus Woesearchaeota archaeon]
MISQKTLIAYGMQFASFLLDSRIGKHISSIILFGSVAREDFTKESDIDIFIDTGEPVEKEAESMLKLFSSSALHKIWEQKGVKNEISLKVGKLKEWPLRREIISSGILLFGKYSQLPENTTYYLLITTDVKNKKPSQQVKLWRRLYGYSQKVGKKVYHGKGLVEIASGKKLGKGIFIVPMEKRKEVIDFLKSNKINHNVFEIWSDIL